MMGVSAVVLVAGAASTVGQDNGPQKDAGTQSTDAHPATGKEAKRRAERLRRERMSPYRKWLDEDVVYIITEEERFKFRQLLTDQERDQFIEMFWLVRNSNPDSEENEFKKEHYRRIAYANELYGAGIPGSFTFRAGRDCL